MKLNELRRNLRKPKADKPRICTCCNTKEVEKQNLTTRSDLCFDCASDCYDVTHDRYEHGYGKRMRYAALQALLAARRCEVCGELRDASSKDEIVRIEPCLSTKCFALAQLRARADEDEE